MSNIDSYQSEVVKSKNDILVIAGPGSGKTTTIINKVNYLLKETNSSQILLLSFTNKSVEDIKKRLQANVYVTTFHKLAIDILKYNNINYKICDTFLLDYIIDEYFLSLSNKDIKKLCRYLNTIKFNKHSQEYISLKKLIKTFISLFKTNNHNINKLHNMIASFKDKYLINIILTILNRYEEEKQSTNTYDFDDLITVATKTLEKNYNYKKFKYIIVDEFQDTSLIRLNLLKIIYDNSNSIITAVGDDAQSIFHFSGCDLNIFLNFNKYFPRTKMIFLKNTYRNSQELIDISSSFINKNKLQIEKHMQSTIHINNPIELIYYFNPIKAFKKILNNLLNETDDIMILGRNKIDIKEYIDNDFEILKDELLYNKHHLKYLTIHSAKGLESKYVIILNMSNKTYGIPNKLENHPILKYAEAEIDPYPYAEERRVFFVAITRCKEKTFIMIPRNNPSVFIKELKKLL
ncbi:MAG: UvrD-helicase domain-containing protein [Bacilli bacterium]|nr:UvrD-helicase domain-containing protein [Bacilli bacterium]